MCKFEENHWTVNCNGHNYECIGYETRGIFGVPIVYFDEHTNDAICSTVYEVIKGYRIVEEYDNICATKLNNTEIELLKSVGCKYDGCWIKKA